MAEGQSDEARKWVQQAWGQLREHGCTGTSNSGQVYRDCAEVFDALGDAKSLRAMLESGHQAFMELTDKITVPAWRHSFLENVPENRAFMQMWDRRKPG